MGGRDAGRVKISEPPVKLNLSDLFIPLPIASLGQIPKISCMNYSLAFSATATS